MTTTPMPLVEAVNPRSYVLSRRTRGLIAELQIEQRDLAAALGMSQSNFSRRVNGHTPFTPNEIQQLAPLLEVSEPYLYGFTEDRTRNDATHR